LNDPAYFHGRTIRIWISQPQSKIGILGLLFYPFMDNALPPFFTTEFVT
jgi:hypothetical protein